MKKLLVLLALGLISLSAGLGVAYATAPQPSEPANSDETESAHAVDARDKEVQDAHGESSTEHGAHEASTSTDAHGAHGNVGTSYVKLPNQFIVPIVRDDLVSAMAILSLGLETPEADHSALLRLRPRFRDALLAALLDHANDGGFSGDFTTQTARDLLKARLLNAAQDIVGDRVSEVLLLDINLQTF